MATLIEPDVVDTENNGTGLAPRSEPVRDPFSMIDMALQNGHAPETIERLSKLAQEWLARQARQQFAVAMNRVQTKLPAVVKDAQNDQTKSRYATLESVQAIARPIYTAEGFALTFAQEQAPLDGWSRTVCDVRHIGGHEVRYHVDLPNDGIGPKGNPIGGMNMVQGVVSTLSYGQRQLLVRIFNITIAEQDRDGQQFITPEQVATLSAMLEETKRDEQAFLRWAAADSLDKVTTRKFNEFMQSIRLMKNTSAARKNGGSK